MSLRAEKRGSLAKASVARASRRRPAAWASSSVDKPLMSCLRSRRSVSSRYPSLRAAWETQRKVDSILDAGKLISAFVFGVFYVVTFLPNFWASCSRFSRRSSASCRARSRSCSALSSKTQLFSISLRVLPSQKHTKHHVGTCRIDRKGKRRGFLIDVVVAVNTKILFCELQYFYQYFLFDNDDCCCLYIYVHY